MHIDTVIEVESLPFGHILVDREEPTRQTRKDGRQRSQPQTVVCSIGHRRLATETKQREESSKTYDDGGRPDLAEQERAEIVIIQEFLPRQMSDEEVGDAVRAVVDEFEATTLKDMGKCMGALKERHQGAMNFGQAGALLKQLLTGKAG